MVASSQGKPLDFSVPSDLEEGARDSEATRRDTEGDPSPSGTSSAGGCMMGGRTGPLAWVILSRLGARRRVRGWETPHCGTPSVCWGWEAWPATPGDPSTHTQPQTLPRVPGRAGHAQPLTSRLQRRQEQQGQLQGQPHGLAPLPGERTGRALKARREACGGAGGDSAPGVRTRLLQRTEEGGGLPQTRPPRQ